MKNRLVRKSNFLIEASYKLSAVEQKIVLILASMIKPDDQEFKKYTFQLKNVFHFLGLNSKNAYAYMKEITKSLLGKVFTIQLSDSLLQTHWISSAHYHEGKGTVEFCFDPQLKPFLLQLKERFTTFKLREVVQFKSSFTIRMYELLKQYEKIGNRTFDVQALRNLLGIEDLQYRLYADFKKRVILVAQEELSEKSDISFSFEEMKIGHAIGKIKFIISTKLREQPAIPDILPSDFPFPKNMKSAEILENPELLKLFETIPGEFRKKESVRKAVISAFEQHGFDLVMRNIVYANEKSNAVKPGMNSGKGSNYRVYLSKALEGDFGLPYKEDKEVKEKAAEDARREAQKEATARKQKLEQAQNEKENHERARVFQKSLSTEALEHLREEAIFRLDPKHQEMVRKKAVGSELMLKVMMDKISLERMKIS